MKKLLLLGLVAALFNSCTECPPDRFTTTSAEIDATKQLVEDYVNGDWEAWLGHYTDDAKVAHNSIEGVSPAEALEGLKGLLATTSAYKFADEPLFYEMITDDDGLTWVYFWGLWQGSLASNGEVVEIPVQLSLNFVDGKISAEYGYYDLSKYFNAIQAAEAAEVSSDAESDTEEE